MSGAPATLAFHRQVRRETAWPASTHHHPPNGSADAEGGPQHQPDDRTPLLAGGARGPSPWPARRDRAYHFFLDRKHTPGDDSSRPWIKWPARVWHVTKITLLSNYANVFLVFVPIGIVAGANSWSATWVFTLNFLAIIPLAAVLSFATEEISRRLGETLGGLLNATFGNAVEMIVSVVALREGQIEVVQSSMLGSILSNLLLVMGMCFFLGGLANMRDAAGGGTEQSFSSATAQTTCSLMALSSASMIIPSTLYSVLSRADEYDIDASILVLSRGTAVILLVLYVMYLYFQLHTHKNLFTAEGDAAAQEALPDHEGEQGEQEDEAAMGPWSAGGVLIATTLIIAVCAEYLVDSIDDLVTTAHISKNFIGLILIPIVGNAAEHVTACVVAVRNKMDLAMGVAIGSSIQIALLVTPFLVILGWLVLDQPMSLHFETFETVAFALSVLVVTYTVQDGKSNYLEGAMLMGLYLIIALAFFVSPSDALDKVGLGWLV